MDGMNLATRMASIGVRSCCHFNHPGDTKPVRLQAPGKRGQYRLDVLAGGAPERRDWLIRQTR